MVTHEEQNCQSEVKKNPRKKFITEEGQYSAGHNKLQHFRAQYENGQMPLGRWGSQGQGTDYWVWGLQGLLCEGEAVQRDYPQTTVLQPFIIFLEK